MDLSLRVLSVTGPQHCHLPHVVMRHAAMDTVPSSPSSHANQALVFRPHACRLSLLLRRASASGSQDPQGRQLTLT